MRCAFILAAILLTGQAFADTGKTPLVVEMFTSKFCPSCPAAEHRMKNVAEEHADVLVIFEHVDYWDRDAKTKDPYGLPDLTQRQYDVASAMGRRPGEVFTPMPIIDGQILVNPPLMFSWGSALEKGRALPEKPRLAVSKDADGSLEIVVPTPLYAANREMWVLGVEQVKNEKAWRVRGLVQGTVKDGKARIAAASMPKGDAYVVLWQDNGPNKIVAMGSLGVNP
ncbi:MAG: DUF1223 domain-containing protein [Alphaproteobacteria bacterium]|nr:MAG: DUF1223 domain-containing protein [Alphaproteobacteria bacterium]